MSLPIESYHTNVKDVIISCETCAIIQWVVFAFYQIAFEVLENLKMNLTRTEKTKFYS